MGLGLFLADGEARLDVLGRLASSLPGLDLVLP